jgi:phosphoglycolate phosphatase-like HAD superfamily hydrolase
MLPLLVLWDIDGTLVELGKSGRNSHMKVVKAIHNCPIAFKPYPGMTDFEILDKILTINEIEFSKDEISVLLVALDKEYSESGVISFPLPGILKCLKLVSSLGGINGIQTGNTLVRATLKLQTAQIESFFSTEYIFTGERSISRIALIDPTNRIFEEFENLVIVGDTQSDFALAQSLDIDSIGLASGESSVLELQQMGFTHAFEDGNELFVYLEKKLRTLR